VQHDEKIFSKRQILLKLRFSKKATKLVWRLLLHVMNQVVYFNYYVSIAFVGLLECRINIYIYIVVWIFQLVCIYYWISKYI
jgi:hypothetical protein